jgi:hypothetical protein
MEFYFILFLSGLKKDYQNDDKGIFISNNRFILPCG